MKQFSFITILFLNLFSYAEVRTNPEYGPEFPAEEVQTLLRQVQTEVTQKTKNQIKIGEFSYYVRTTQAENQFPIVLKQEADTITAKNVKPSRVKYTITHQKAELQNNGQLKPLPPTQSTFCFELTPNGCNSDLLNISLSQLLKDNMGSPAHWTFHNLKKSYSSFPVPELVLLRSDCGKRDLINKKCEDPLETIEISFDQVDWSNQAKPVKYSYKLVFSKELPFFGSLLQQCGIIELPQQNQRVAIMQCETLKDFTFGHD